MLFHIADGKVVYANRQGEEALSSSRQEASSGNFEIFQLVAVAPEYLNGRDILALLAALRAKEVEHLAGS